MSERSAIDPPESADMASSARMAARVRSLGWPGVLGLAAIVVALLLEHVWLVPLETQIESLRNDAARDVRDRSRIAAANARADLPKSRLAAFYAFFERPERATDHLATIYALAQKLGLGLTAGDYRLAERDAEGGIRLYTVTLPVSGTYAQVRALAANVLQEIPVASLDRVEFKRRGNEPQTVDATLEFTLFLRVL